MPASAPASAAFCCVRRCKSALPPSNASAKNPISTPKASSIATIITDCPLLRARSLCTVFNCLLLESVMPFTNHFQLWCWVRCLDQLRRACSKCGQVAKVQYGNQRSPRCGHAHLNLAERAPDSAATSAGYGHCATICDDHFRLHRSRQVSRRNVRRQRRYLCALTSGIFYLAVYENESAHLQDAIKDNQQHNRTERKLDGRLASHSESISFPLGLLHCSCQFGH